MGTERTARTVLHLLDTFDLRHDGRSVTVPAPAQRLLAYLALQSRPSPRRTVARTLWADRDETQAAARLRSTLWRLPAPDGSRLVQSTGGRLVLTDRLDVDIRLGEMCAIPEEADVDALRGDVLTEWTEPWVVVERESFRQEQLHRLELHCQQARDLGHFAMALRCAMAAVAVEPLRESAHRQVMLTHLAEGNPSEALRQFEFVRRLLRDELGLAPSAATRAVVGALLGRPLDLRTTG